MQHIFTANPIITDSTFRIFMCVNVYIELFTLYSQGQILITGFIYECVFLLVVLFDSE